MKTIVALMLIGCAKVYAGNDLRLLDAISQVESSNMDSAVGNGGERGRWQISEAVWKQHSHDPFTDAHIYWKARVVAIRHMRWLRENIEVEDVTPWNLACAWKCGIRYMDRAEDRQQYLARLDYARRVLALYMEESK